MKRLTLSAMETPREDHCTVSSNNCGVQRQLSPSDQNYIPFKKEGSGHYSSLVQVQHKLIEAFTPLVLALLDNTRPIPGQAFVIGDYGTADGGTSENLIREAIALLRNKHGDELPIQVIYEDQPINDFKPIFLRAQDFTAQFPNVFILASGCSFYTQCLPPNSLDFIMCITSILWLSKCPKVQSPVLFPTYYSGPAKEALVKQAEEDWENFLLLRGKELKSGGYLVVTTLTSDEDDRVETSDREMFSHVSDIWRDMYEEGLITQNEFEFTQFGMHVRSHDELEKPFKDEHSPVSRSGLSLVSVEKYIIPYPFREELRKLQQSENVDSSVFREHARYVGKERRACQESSILEGLEKHRSAEEKEAIIDVLHQRYEDMIADDFRKHHSDVLKYCLVIRKNMNGGNSVLSRNI